MKGILRGMGQSLSQGIEIPVVLSPLIILFSFAVAVIVSLLSRAMEALFGFILGNESRLAARNMMYY